MKSDDFFKVDKFPTVTVKIDKIAGGKATGTMTLLGKSGAISLPVKEKNGTYTGQLVFDRTKWGLEYGSDSFFKGLGDKAISNTVKLDVKLVTK